jgi:hypothetical protein
MRLSTTSVGTKRPLLGLLLLAELILAVSLLGDSPVPAPARPPAAAPASLITPGAPQTLTLRDGRTVALVGLGGPRTAPLLARIAAQMDDAANAVTMFWGSDWPREILIVAAGSDAQFGSLAGGGADIAATTTSERIMFAPGAAGMSDGALRIVLRHELFHYASRADTAADAPRWLTEGVADFVGRPATPRPENAAELAQLPTDVDLNGPEESLAYDRAWWFSRFVADEYGTSTLRALYLRACGPGHPDAATAVRDTLGADLDTVLTRWRQWLTG